VISPIQFLFSFSFFLPWSLWGDTRVDLVTHSFFSHYDFVRVSEYFTGKENTSGRVILRSHEGKRDGLYLLIDLGLKEKVSGVQSRPHKLQLQILDSQSLDPVTYSFLLSEQAVAKGEVWLGLTGKDWPTPKKKIMAWHISVEAKDESILTNNQSYLWSHKE
jgi:hypothetical protein